MKIAMIGLGRMGLRLASRLDASAHEVVGFDPSADAVAAAKAKGLKLAASLKEIVLALEAPRLLWLMLPAGEATGQTLETLSEFLEPGDTVVDGGNSDYRETLNRSENLKKKGIHLVDCGTSGGLAGAKEGYCLMAGGSAESFARVEPLLKSLAEPRGAYLHAGQSGAGHYIKMVHNAVEYGMMQSIAEGSELLKAGSELGVLPVQALKLWRQGSVVRSWLVDLAAQALKEDPDLKKYTGVVGQSGEGQWAFETAQKKSLPVPALKAALEARAASAQRKGFSEKMLSALRAGFGGHAEPKI